ncbi:MAG: helix-turn-helix domain-containing protein [Bacteroidia bacterium]|nr:helix-turn-helix domain-containing protein [Bacteroidia bacterium]
MEKIHDERKELVVTLTVEELKQIIVESLSILDTPKPDETLLTRKEVAMLLKVSLVTINRWMKEGRIPYHRIHSRIYFRRSEVEEALNRPSHTGKRKSS